VQTPQIKVPTTDFDFEGSNAKFDKAGLMSRSASAAGRKKMLLLGRVPSRRARRGRRRKRRKKALRRTTRRNRFLIHCRRLLLRFPLMVGTEVEV